MGRPVYSVCKRLISVCFFVNKRPNDELPFARRANGEQIRENRLGLGFHRFLFDVSMSPFLHVSISLCLCLHVSMTPSPCLHVSMSPCFHVSGIPQTENTTNGKPQCPFVYGKLKQQLTFVYCKRKRNWKFVFLGRKTINFNQLLFQQTCPSMDPAHN